MVTGKGTLRKKWNRADLYEYSWSMKYYFSAASKMAKYLEIWAHLDRR